MKAELIICDVCGKEGARRKHVSRACGKGEAMFVIDNVPIVVCPHCGQSYMTADTMREVERIKLHKRSMKTQRLAPVVNFA
jgi:YgiT-type zinc finger domain-containing protein